jgi:hypothetical protein
MTPRRPRETESIVRRSHELIEALRAVLDSSPFAGLGPIELARALGIDKTLASRLMSALRASDRMVALSLLPGVVPMRQLLAALRQRGAGARALAAAERKLGAFDHELVRTFGNRTRLDALIAGELPEARRRHEDAARQAVYRGMALIKGVSIEKESFTWIVHPGRRNARRADLLFLAGFVGIHRLRPAARFRVGGSHRKARPAQGATILRKFCRPQGLSITTSSEKDYTFYEIVTGSVRRDAAADFFLSERMRDAVPRKAPGPGWIAGDVLMFPVRRLELNLLIHEDVWPGIDFVARSHDTAGRGMAHFPDPEREFDELPLHAQVVRSPANAETLRSSLVPRYTQILAHLTGPLGWSWETASGSPAFRMFRCTISYPLYGAQIMLFPK